MTKWTLAIAVLALGAVACGGDDDNNNNDKDAGDTGGNTGASSGGSSGNSNVNIPDGGDCTLEQVKEEVGEVGEQWTMAPPWSRTQAMTCFATCTDGSTECIGNCPNGMQFLECFTGEILHCGADVNDAPCESEYQAFGCCILDKCSEAATQADFDKCLEDNCDTQVTGLFDCSQEACTDAAAAKCASAPETGDGGMRVFNPQMQQSFMRDLGKKFFDRFQAKTIKH